MSATVSTVQLNLSHEHNAVQGFLRMLHLPSSSQATTRATHRLADHIIGLLTGKTLDQEDKDLQTVGSFGSSKHTQNPALTPHEDSKCSHCNILQRNWQQLIKSAGTEEYKIRSMHFDKTLALTRGVRLIAAASVAVLIGLGASIPWMTTAGVVAALAAILYMGANVFMHRNDPTVLSQDRQEKLANVLNVFLPQQSLTTGSESTSKQPRGLTKEKEKEREKQDEPTTRSDSSVTLNT